jgi:hypothetical protein
MDELNLDDKEAVEQWVGWAKRELASRLSRLMDAEYTVSGQRSTISDLQKRCDSLEEVVRSRPKLAILEPGTEAYLAPAGDRKVRIQEAMVRPGNQVHYRVAYYDASYVWREHEALAEDLVAELPLDPPDGRDRL